MVVGQLVEGSRDVLAAVLVDAAGALLDSSDGDRERSLRLADLARELVERADAVADAPVEQIEVQTGTGSAFAVRSPRHVLACAARRTALPALVLYDLRHALAEVEAGG